MDTCETDYYRGIWLMSNRTPLGPYRMPLPRVLGGPTGSAPAARGVAAACFLNAAKAACQVALYAPWGADKSIKWKTN